MQNVHETPFYAKCVYICFEKGDLHIVKNILHDIFVEKYL